MSDIEQVRQEVLALLPPVQAIRDVLMGNMEKNPGADTIEYWVGIRDSMQQQQAASAPAAADALASANAAAGGGFETKPGEDGNIAQITAGRNSQFPYLYSVPQLWAKTPSALLVPRAIAEADGLTPK